MDPIFDLKYIPRGSDDKSRRFGIVEFPYGQAPIEEFLNSEKHSTRYLPDVSAVAFVRNVLYSNGLPTELVDDVMERADYTVKRRLVHPDDPFHLRNMEELQKYLKYCWKLIVDCNMMADALGVKIEWEDLIYRTLSWQISSSGGRKIRRLDVDD